MSVRTLGAFVLTLAIVGCATTRPIPAPDWNQLKLEREALNHWELTGRAAVATGTDGWNASLEWTQNSNQARVQLQGPFGAGALRVNIDGTSLAIETAKGERFAGEEARAELERRLSVPLPLESLRYWLLGIPEPGKPALAQLDPQGHLGQLDQFGWRILYDRYTADSLPGRIRAERGDLKLKIVVDRWRL